MRKCPKKGLFSTKVLNWGKFKRSWQGLGTGGVTNIGANFALQEGLMGAAPLYVVGEAMDKNF